MEILTLTSTEDTPEVILNKEKGIFKITGNSFSEDPFTIYVRIFSWFNEYISNPNDETHVQFELNYINTASSKQIVEMLKILEALTEKSKVIISWYYQEGDDDTYSEGEELSNMFNLDFKFVEYLE